MSLIPDQRLFEYQIVRVLGQGGFGTVYLAHDTLLDRPVAIKELTITAQTDEVAFKRFIQEARVAGGLNHPHVVTIYALKVADPHVYLAMEYLAGGSLRALLEERGSLPVEQAVRIAAEVCEGLAAAHVKGIVHRDVKPENILLMEDGRAKVGDFGIAHVPRGAGGTSLTQAGFQPGTLTYMSPEQIRGQQIDGRSDVYQVGALLYEMLAGRHYIDIDALRRQAGETAGSNVMLFQARLFELLSEVICERELMRACRVLQNVPTWVGDIVTAALTKKTADRPNAVRLAQALLERSMGQVISTEKCLNRGKVHVEQGSLDAQRGVTSTQQMSVVGRPGSELDNKWQELGSTPGRVEIPPGYELGIRMHNAIDSTLATVTCELASSGPIRLLDLSQSYITNTGLAHLRGLPGLMSLDLSCCRNITDMGLACLKVLTDLTNLRLRRCEQITDAGLAYVGVLTSLTSLDLCGCRKITDMGLAQLKALTNLVSLDLWGCWQITNVGLAHLEALVNLASLNLDCEKITDAGLAHLGVLARLTRLSLEDCRYITHAGLVGLATLTNLVSLDLWGCKLITDAGLAYLVTLTNLTSLNIQGCRRVTDAGLAYLKALTGLTSLGLGGCSGITDAGLAHLKVLTSLTSLGLGGCSGITDAGLAHLEALTGLTSLRLSACEKITDVGLEHLRALTNLTSLSLGMCRQITDAGLVHLKTLTGLTCLDLAWGPEITDVGLEHLRALTNLTSLDLRMCKQITDTGLAHLKPLTGLTSLTLDGCEQITDAGLAHLESLTSLTSLDLGGFNSQITDTGLAHLEALTNLTSLTLGQCPQATGVGLDHVLALPSLTRLQLREEEYQRRRDGESREAWVKLEAWERLWQIER